MQATKVFAFQMSLLAQGIIKVVLSVIMVLIETSRPLFYC